MKIFVTGGTGFIGSHVVMMLVEQGHEVSVLARNPDKIPAFHNILNIKLIEGDCLDREKVSTCVKGMDAVIHLALCWGESATKMLLNDTLQSVSLFEAAANEGVKHFIYTSSTAAFGDYKPIMTEDMLSDSIDFYCATKASSERFLLATSYQTEMRCNIIRPGYTFGRPVMDGAPVNPYVVKDIIDSAKKDEEIEIMKNIGTQVISAKDIVRIYSAILNTDVNRQIYFALGKTFIKTEDIAQKIITRMKSKSKIILTENIYGEKPRLFAPLKVERDFGLSFEGWEEVNHLIDYYLN